MFTGLSNLWTIDDTLLFHRDLLHVAATVDRGRRAYVHSPHGPQAIALALGALAINRGMQLGEALSAVSEACECALDHAVRSVLSTVPAAGASR